jgi:hypothetical protein
MLIPILISVSYFFGCFGAALAAEKKVVSSQSIFHVAVIFTPLIALIVVYFSPKKKVVQTKKIICKNYVFDFEGKHVSNPESDKKRIIEIEEPHYS